MRLNITWIYMKLIINNIYVWLKNVDTCLCVVCSCWQICKEKKSQKLADAVKIEDMQIYKPVIRCHLLVHEEKEKIDSPI